MCSLCFSDCYVREEPRLSWSPLTVCVFKEECHLGLITAQIKLGLHAKRLSARCILKRRRFAAGVVNIFRMHERSLSFQQISVYLMLNYSVH